MRLIMGIKTTWFFIFLFRCESFVPAYVKGNKIYFSGVSTNIKKQTILVLRANNFTTPLALTEVESTNYVHKILNAATSLFPLWVSAFVLLGLISPKAFSWCSEFVAPALGMTMVCMGMSLSVRDFATVLRKPQLVMLGFLSQYIIMPLLAYTITKIFKLGPDLSAGLILVGCAPGGTASNVVTLIAKADVALSVVMTACSTLAAVVVTPYLTKLLIGSSVDIKASALMVSTLEVVLLPVLFGLSLNTFAPKFCASVSRFTPFLSVLLVAGVCGTVAASNSHAIFTIPTVGLFLSVVLLHFGGFLLGYLVSKFLHVEEKSCRTIRFHITNNKYICNLFIVFIYCIFYLCHSVCNL